MRPEPTEEPAPPRIEANRPWPLPLVLSLAALGLAGAALLFAFDPARHAFYPVCLFKKMTGYDCPGCGGLRAMHQLLRGDVWRAFQLNPLVVVGLPLLGLWFIRTRRTASRRRQSGSGTVLFWAWLLFTTVVVFGVMRNLPFWPFGVTPM